MLLSNECNIINRYIIKLMRVRYKTNGCSAFTHAAANANATANQRTVAQPNGVYKSSKTRRLNYMATGRPEEWQ